MHPFLPDFIFKHFEALAAPSIALIAASIAYAQWRTARNKFVFNLFDKRDRVIRDLHMITGTFLTEGRVDQDLMNKMIGARLQARFLFGRDVTCVVDKMLDSLYYSYRFSDERIASRPNSDDLWQKKDQANKVFTAFIAKTDRLFAPYMKLDMRL